MVPATKAERPVSVQLSRPSPGRIAMGKSRRLRSFRPCRWAGRISLGPWFEPSGPKRWAKPPKPFSCQTLGEGLGLTLVLGSGPVFFRPSPRQTSLEARRCKIEEGAEFDRQESAGWINEAHRKGRWPVLVEHRGQGSCLDGRRDVIRERAREADAGPGRVTRRPFVRDDKARTDRDRHVGLSAREGSYLRSLKTLAKNAVVASNVLGRSRRSV